MAYRPLAAVVLAAGDGTRMRSDRPKPLHRLCGRPMVLYVLDALAELPVEEVVVVVGHRGEWVSKAVTEQAPAGLSLTFVEQPERRGTADALAVGLTALSDRMSEADGDVLVLPGDAPLLRAETLATLVRVHRVEEAAATLLSTRVEGASAGLRVVRGKDAKVVAVVPAATADRLAETAGSAAGRSGARRRAGRLGEPEEDADGGQGAPEASGVEVATTVHCFRQGVLAPALRRIGPSGRDGEHHLADVYGVLSGAGYSLASVPLLDPDEAAGVNDRAQLAAAEAELRRRINLEWMRKGVTMWDPARTYVDATVVLAPETVLLPGVILQGATVVGPAAEVGPDCLLVDCEVGAGARVVASHARHARIGEGATVGPFVALAEGAVVAAGEQLRPPGPQAA
jgi:bifunctional UDP-N-acetylglucosamine pyrophosphorylase/glucosamine-1-phosphate N-acetyltransferase